MPPPSLLPPTDLVRRPNSGPGRDEGALLGPCRPIEKQARSLHPSERRSHTDGTPFGGVVPCSPALTSSTRATFLDAKILLAFFHCTRKQI